MENGLVYGGSETVQELVNKDTDGDGVADWEEGLWGTDPTKRDTDDDGIDDGVETDRKKYEPGENTETAEESENLTETDKFSREFFSTVATLNQSGEIDQATVEQLSTSLAEHIKNPVPRKVFLLSDIKLSTSDDAQAATNYSDALGKVLIKYPINYTVVDILQRFIIDENNVDVSVLSELDPIIEKMSKIIDELAEINVPQSLLSPHLGFINALQRLLENINDIKLYDADVIIALSAISQYEKNSTSLQTYINSLTNAIEQKLNE